MPRSCSATTRGVISLIPYKSIEIKQSGRRKRALGLLPGNETSFGGTEKNGGWPHWRREAAYTDEAGDIKDT